MQSDITGQVLGVSGAPTRTNKLMYSVAFSDGNSYTTFDAGMATKAQQLQGQTVSARVEQKPKQNGQGFYLNLIDIAGQGQLPPLAMPMQPGLPIAGVPIMGGGAVGAPAPGIPIQAPASGGGGGNFPEPVVVRIVKLAVIDSAASLVGQLFQGAGPEAFEEAVNLTETLAKRLYEQARAHEAPAVPPAQVPVQAPQTPQEVAAAVPGVQVGTEGVQAPTTRGPEW